jgi:hypothetical protein
MMLKTRGAGCLLAAVVGLLALPTVADADTIITDFNSATLGSYNPRENWSAFGNGTLDRGVHSAGSVGRGAFHTVDWSSASWGVGDVSVVAVDLSAFTAVRIDARVVELSGYSGVARLRFALDHLDGREWTTPSIPITGGYVTYEFDFADLSGSGALDLVTSKPKLIVEKNGQSGTARFDFDEIVAVGAGGGTYELTPVALRPPPDGDAIRAMWMYAGSIFASATASQSALDFCGREGVNRINLGAYSIWANGSAELKDNLRLFLETAHASGIRVEALLDGVDWHENPALVRTRVDQILAFHDDTPANTADDFDAVHFDVEFWLDSSFTDAANETIRQQVARDYLDNVLVNARDHLDANGASSIDVATDLSAHFDISDMLPSAFSYDGVTQRFLQHVLDHADDVVIMSYIDSASGLLSWTGYELDLAHTQGRTIQLGADIHFVPPELSINSFADNSPSAFSAMTTALEQFHLLLTADRLAALDGFSVFYYDGYSSFEPSPRNVADLDGDGDADTDDLASFASQLGGPAVAAQGLAVDDDLDLDGDVDLVDFARFTRCFTGAGQTGPIANECLR